MSNELPGRIIKKFVSGGPKNYCYLHCKPDGSDTKMTVKIRSFQMTAEAERKLNFTNMLALVLHKFGPNRL